MSKPRLLVLSPEAQRLSQCIELGFETKCV